MTKVKHAFLTVGKFFAVGWFVYTAYFLFFLHSDHGYIPQWLAKTWGILMFLLLLGGITAMLINRSRKKL
jgi:multisubunit Na+/H+ antiporter MnhG subunit